MLPFSRIFKAAVVAGLVAGLFVATFHFILTEPVIDQAIQLEQQPTDVEVEQEQPLVSRNVQKGGLFVGFLLYGLSWALLFTVVYHLLQRWLLTFGVWQGVLLLGFLVYWAVVLIPFLKYPANPPGVGEAETIGYRQNLYLSFLFLSIGSTVLAVRLGHYISQRLKVSRFWLITLAWLGLFAVVLVQFMPSNPDTSNMPAELLLQFRLRSLAGLTLFWSAFGLCFGWLGQKAYRSTPGRIYGGT